MQWRIYYTDGSCFDSRDGTPAEAPGGGVAAIGVGDEVVGCEILQGQDFYVYHERYDGWRQMDYFGLVQHILESHEPIIVKLGQTMSTAKFRELIGDMANHGLRKSARHRWEPPYGL